MEEKATTEHRASSRARIFKILIICSFVNSNKSAHCVNETNRIPLVHDDTGVVDSIEDIAELFDWKHTEKTVRINTVYVPI